MGYQSLNHRRIIGDTGTLHDFVCAQYLSLGVLTLLPTYIVSKEYLLIPVLDVPHITYKDIVSLLLGKYSSPYATLSSTEYYNSLHLLVT